MATAKFYDLDTVHCSLAGRPISGYGEGGSITISYDEDKFSVTVGRDGDVVRSKTNNKVATAEVTLLQTSTANKELGLLSKLDDDNPNGAGVGMFICRDQVNQDEYTGAQAWINKDPDVEFAQEQTDRTWTIKIAHLKSFPGGRSS